MNNFRIEMIDMNVALKDSNIMNNFRELTLDGFPQSGLNTELNMFERIVLDRPVDASAITVYDEVGSMIAWALCSREPSDFEFSIPFEGQGVLFEVFVDYNHRKKGIGSALLKKAHEMFPEEQFYVCPWNYTSDRFYTKNGSNKQTII